MNLFNQNNVITNNTKTSLYQSFVSLTEMQMLDYNANIFKSKEGLMNILSQKTRFFLVMLGIAVLTSTATSLGNIEDTINKSFPVGPGGTLLLDTDRGSIQVKGQEGNRVDIEIIREAKTSDSTKAKEIFDYMQFDFKQNGNDVTIHGTKNTNSSKNLNKLNIKFIISVPQNYNVDLGTSGGSISVDDLEGSVDIRTSGGSLSLNNVKGSVTGETSGGSITVGEVKGNVKVNTSGGSIRIENAHGTVNAHTSGGGITVNEVMGTIQADTSGGSVKAYISQQPKGDCRLKTSGGSITVYLFEDIAIDVNAGTSGGSIHSEFPVTIQGKVSNKELKAKINGGGPELYLNTSGGSIYIKKK
jgi:hypothetical protein